MRNSHATIQMSPSQRATVSTASARSCSLRERSLMMARLASRESSRRSAVTAALFALRSRGGMRA